MSQLVRTRTLKKEESQNRGPDLLLLFQVLIEPFNRELDRLIARRCVDAVVCDAGNLHVFLRPGHSIVRQFRVILVIEELFLFGDDE